MVPVLSNSVCNTASVALLGDYKAVFVEEIDISRFLFKYLFNWQMKVSPDYSRIEWWVLTINIFIRFWLYGELFSATNGGQVTESGYLLVPRIDL